MVRNQEDGRINFGKCLGQLLVSANIKNSTVAAALNYDVSYISKWVTGKALPSKKNAEKVLHVISDLAADSAAPELMRQYGTEDKYGLKEEIYQLLRDAYYQASGIVFREQHVNNALLYAAPRSATAFLEEYISAMEPGEGKNIGVLADLFGLDHVSKLNLAGISNGHFRMRKYRDDLNIDYIVDLDGLDGDSVYDVILLIHMMTNFSCTKFHLYHSRLAKGKLLIAIENECAGVTLLSQNHHFLCSTVTQEKRAAEEIYHVIQESIDPDRLLFGTRAMESLLLEREYFHNLFSQGKSWLVGHVTEHFLPKDLFYRLADAQFNRNSELYREAERAYLMTADMLDKEKVRVIFYYLALVDFMLTGEADFFNNRVILSRDDRVKVLLHIKEVMQTLGVRAVKMVQEGFSDDFKYITNPCMFLSDTVSYLRLENKLYRNNILLIKDERTKRIFELFYEKIWHEYQNVMIGDYNQMLKKLDDLIETSLVVG